MQPCTPTGVISARGGAAHYIEFHLRQDDPPRAAHVHACLLRINDRDIFWDLQTRIATLVDTVARLAHLDKVVLETGRRVSLCSKIQALLEMLRNTCRVTVLVELRTCDEAHKIALQAKKSPRSTGEDLLSPFWCLQEHQWARLRW